MKTIDLSQPLTPELQPDIRPLNGLPVSYRLMDEVCFIISPVVSVTVPKGFEYDGMSIPRAVRSLVDLEQDGPHRAADLLHDWLYEHDDVNQFTREMVDRFFAQLCRMGGMSEGIVAKAFDAVRWCGWIFWRQHHKTAAFAAHQAVDDAPIRPRTITLDHLIRLAGPCPASLA